MPNYVSLMGGFLLKWIHVVLYAYWAWICIDFVCKLWRKKKKPLTKVVYFILFSWALPREKRVETSTVFTRVRLVIKWRLIITNTASQLYFFIWLKHYPITVDLTRIRFPITFSMFFQAVVESLELMNFSLNLKYLLFVLLGLTDLFYSIYYISCLIWATCLQLIRFFVSFNKVAFLRKCLKFFKKKKKLLYR